MNSVHLRVLPPFVSEGLFHFAAHTSPSSPPPARNAETAENVHVGGAGAERRLLSSVSARLPRRGHSFQTIAQQFHLHNGVEEVPPPPMGCVVSGGVLGRGEATVQLAGLGKISGHLRETASGQGGARTYDVRPQLLSLTSSVPPLVHILYADCAQYLLIFNRLSQGRHMHIPPPLPSGIRQLHGDPVRAAARRPAALPAPRARRAVGRHGPQGAIQKGRPR